MCFIHQIFVLSEIQNNLCKCVPIFDPSQFELFDLKNLKNSNFINSFLKHYSQPKFN